MDIRFGHKEGWAPKNWCFRIMLLEKTLGSLLNCKEIRADNPKRNQPWIFTGRTVAEAPIMWLPYVKCWLIGKDPDAGKDWRQEEKGVTEDEMVGWHHWLNGHEFEQTPGEGKGQRAWHAVVPGVTKSWTRLSNWATTACNTYSCCVPVCSVTSDSLQPLDCSMSGFPFLHYFHSNSLSQWCHPTISSSVTPFSSCPQSFPASGSFHMRDPNHHCIQGQNPLQASPSQ